MIRNYVYIIILFLSLSSVFAIQGCDDDDGVADRKIFKVGLSQCALDTHWRKQMNKSLEANAAQRENIILKITDGENSNAKQIQDIKDLVTEGIDLLLVSPNEADSLTPVVSEVYKKNIPVILIDRRINSDDYTCFIGADNTEIGGKAADYLNIFCGNRRDILEIHGQKGASAALERSRGFNARLDKNKGFRHAGDLFCCWSRGEAYQKVKKFWQEGGRFDIIYSHNDDMAVGAYDALKELGVDIDDFTILGTDGASGPEGGIKAVVDGKIDVTFFYPDGSEEVIEAVEKILRDRQKVAKILDLKTVQIDSNNAEGLLGQMEMTRKQEDRILKLNTTIKLKNSKISDQRIGLIIVSIFLVVGVAMLIVIYRFYTKNKLQYVQLNEKNAEINAQKEELESQAVYLSQMNEQLRVSKEQTLGSIRYAQTIQRAALPMEQELNGYFNAFIVYRPKDIVSGDFYWYDRERTGKTETFIFGVIDCTGHGVPGAFMSLIGINLLDQIIKQRKITDPAEILEELNLSVRSSLRQDETENNDGMEAALCKIEVEPLEDGTKKFSLTYEGAKFPVYHYRKKEGDIAVYKTSRREIGGKFRNIEAALTFEDHRVELCRGDRIYMASDGIGDQNNYIRKRYTTRRLVNAIMESVSLNMHEQRDFIWNDLQQFKGDCSQRDDITVMGIEIV